eukprot:753915-Hanusia_phi.AAC.8
MRNLAYTGICASGKNAAILHYGHAGAPNNRQLGEGDIVLNDLGAEYYCYASDITCSFPVSGKFSQEQKKIYEAVLDAKESVIARARPGVSWVEMHELTERIIAKHLLEIGVLKGNLEDIIKAEVPAVFMPHGLGHNLGRPLVL